MNNTFQNIQHGAANDSIFTRSRTVPIPSSITSVPNYPNKLAVYKIPASKYWQVRCWLAGRTHKQSTKTTNLTNAQRFARWFYEMLLVKYTLQTISNQANDHTEWLCVYY